MLYRRLSTELDDVFNKVKKKGQLRLKFDEDIVLPFKLITPD